MSIFIVDSNFFINAHRATYPLDIAFSFWNKVKQLAEEGKIISIDKVRNEIYNKNDMLEAWCKQHLPQDFFKDTSKVMGEYSQVTAWAYSRNNHYIQSALHEFLDADEADAFIIAFALAEPKNRVVVTQEISDSKRKNKVKIPDGCNALQLNFVNTIGMFRKLGETF